MFLLTSGSFDFDNYTRENDYCAFIGRGVYSIAQGTRPIDNDEEYGIFYNIHVPSNSNYTVQLFLRIRSDLGIYIRRYNSGWTSWEKITKGLP